ncbi:MAG TPA: PLP-dependent aminotransferase family protein [Solirubrobacteraceae bacterium]|jgi:GntR family transcriptional regulator/MocR family aminotransferase|nr:PLP-dependent aminotransferase family protein [Solirubrobacteraceae bacterium]
METGTNSGPELLISLDRGARAPLRAQLEDGLREAVRSGRLAPHSRLPTTRALAGDLGVSRRLVVDAYAQLLAEGYLSARRGSGTFVAAAASGAPASEPGPEPAALQFDFFPGNPDLSLFPRRAWLRAVREAMRAMPDRALGYPDPRGALPLRHALAEHLRRVRGVVAEPEAIVICSGAAQAFALMAQVLDGGRVAVEDPGLPVHRAMLSANGAEVVGMPVDEQGACVGELERLGADAPIVAALVTPAHQSPTGVALAPARRSELLAWGAEGDRVLIEDDYDAEFRYDRAPLAAMQGLAPDRVVYTGTISKTLAPALRIGWLVLPARLVERVAERKLLADHGSSTLDQLALAWLLESGAYDSHLRAARRRYRARRDALVRGVAAYLPGATVEGVAAGLHAIVRLPAPVPGLAVARAAAARSVGVYPVGYGYIDVRPVDDRFVLGYANLAEPAIEEGMRRFAEALEEAAGGPAETNEAGAIAR